MTDQADRIKQMAKQAHNWADEAMMHDASLADPEAWSNAMYAKFAALVAEDCAACANERLTSGRSPMGKVAAEAIRARYGLKGE